MLHCFQDILRERQLPILTNAPAESIARRKNDWLVHTPRLSLAAEHILIATGGVSYPKTGSVGDGQKLARAHGHSIEPYRPGLAGYELTETWQRKLYDLEIQDVRVTILDKGKNTIGTTEGDLIFTRWGVRGGAFVNACSVCSRLHQPAKLFRVDLQPTRSHESLNAIINMPKGKHETLGDSLTRLFPAPFVRLWLEKELALSHSRPLTSLKEREKHTLCNTIKNWPLTPKGTRPLKEAMITVGGVRLSEINPGTMQSTKQPGLFFAGEVLDIDGPTGGYNLQMAFSTARLAVSTIAIEKGLTASPIQSPRPHKRPHRKRRRPSQRPSRRQRRR